MKNLIVDYLKFNIRVKKPMQTYINLTYKEQGILMDITNKHKAKFNIFRDNLIVSFCPYKFLYETEDNTRGVSYQELLRCFKKAEGIIKQIEERLNIIAETSIYKANINRIDLTKNIQTKELFHCYIPVFETLRPKQILNFSKVKHTIETHYSSVYFQSKVKTKGNRSLKVRIYDKNNELKSRKLFPAKENHNKNIMRIELELNNLKVIEQKLHIRTIEDLLNCGFNYLENKRDEILKEYLFYEHIENDTPCLNSLDDIELARKIRAENSRNALYKYTICKNLNKINYQYEKEILEKAGYKLKEIEKHHKDLKRYRRQFHLKMNTPTIEELYKEIFLKLFVDRENIQKINVA